MKTVLQYLHSIHPLSPALEEHLHTVLQVKELAKKEFFLKAGHVCQRIGFVRQGLLRMIGIRFTHLIPGVYQIDLFNDDNETIKLYQQIDSIKKRFGQGSLGRASVI